MGILDAHAPGLDAPDAPGCRAHEENVSCQALDGEILVYRTDHDAFRLGDHLIIRILRDSATGGDRGQPRAAASANNAVDLVAMQKSAAPAPRAGDPFGEHF